MRPIVRRPDSIASCVPSDAPGVPSGGTDGSRGAVAGHTRTGCRPAHRRAGPDVEPATGQVDPAAVLLFVGYQGEGTLGAHLQAGAKVVRIDGQQREVRCKIRSISGFSAHAGESELLSWLGNFARGKSPGSAGFPRLVFLVHGDPEAQIAIEPKVRALGFETKIPKWRERVTLD